MPAPAKIRQSPICSLSRATALGALKENDNRKKRRSLISMERRRIDPKQCADKHLGTKFRKRGNPLYLAFLIGRTKSTLNYDIFNFSLMSISLLSALTAGRVRPSTHTLFAFSRRGPCIPSAFGTWPSHALHQVHKQGCPSSLALSSRRTEAGKR